MVFGLFPLVEALVDYSVEVGVSCVGSLLFYLFFCAILIVVCFLLFIFLVFSLCEDLFGLSISVSMFRIHDKDYIQSYSVLQC